MWREMILMLQNFLYNVLTCNTDLLQNEPEKTRHKNEWECLITCFSIIYGSIEPKFTVERYFD